MGNVCPCFQTNRSSQFVGSYERMGVGNTWDQVAGNTSTHQNKGYFEIKNKSKENIRVSLYEGGLMMAKMNRTLSGGVVIRMGQTMRDQIKPDTSEAHVIIEYGETRDPYKTPPVSYERIEYYKIRPRGYNVLLKYSGNGYCKKQEGRNGINDRGIALNTNMLKEPERIAQPRSSTMDSLSSKSTATTASYEGMAGAKALIGKNKNSARLGQQQGYLELKNKSSESIRVQILQSGNHESVVVHPDNALQADFDSSKDYADLLIFHDLGDQQLCFEHNFLQKLTWRCNAKGKNCLLKFKDKGKLSKQSGRFGKSNEGIPISTNMEGEPGLVPDRS